MQHHAAIDQFVCPFVLIFCTDAVVLA